MFTAKQGIASVQEHLRQQQAAFERIIEAERRVAVLQIAEHQAATELASVLGQIEVLPESVTILDLARRVANALRERLVAR